MDIEEKLAKLKYYEDLEAQGRLIKLPCPLGTTLYRIDSHTRACSYYHNTRDNMYYCINDYKCRHLCDGKCNAGIDYTICTINNATAMAILGNESLIGTRVFLDKESAEKELAKKKEAEQQLMLKASRDFDHPYKAYYCDYLYEKDDDED